VALQDATGTPLPFQYINGNGMYVSHTKPTPITLPPGARAYVKVGKYRCDLPGGTPATTIILTAAGIDVSGRLPTWHTLAYCGPGDPGDQIGVSAVVATFDAAGG
jgi:hypothetical protein